MNPRANQRGAALLITLVLVALISLVAFGAGATTSLQQHLSSNEVANQIAFQAAQAALREAESAINSANFDCYDIDAEGAADDKRWEQLESQGNQATFSLYDSLSDDWIPAPRYAIGCVTGLGSAVVGQSVSTTRYFRVFSVGYGPDRKTRLRLEARYALAQ
jgi:type IV pilus assembly protein PilX